MERDRENSSKRSHSFHSFLFRLRQYWNDLWQARPKSLPKSRKSEEPFSDLLERLGSEEIRTSLLEQGKLEGVVASTIYDALRDYLHLREILLDADTSSDVILEVERIGLAEDCLRNMIAKANPMQRLSQIAAERQVPVETRRLAGDSILSLRDEGKKLSVLCTSAAQWAASLSEEDAKTLEKDFAALDSIRRH